MLKTAKFLIKEAGLRVKYMTAKDCIFCKIVAGDVECNFLLENDSVVAFADVNPVANVHILIVPKKHVETVLTVGDSDGQILVAMFKAACELVKKKSLEAFRLAFNGGSYQHVGHLHMHLLSGGSVKWERL